MERKKEYLVSFDENLKENDNSLKYNILVTSRPVNHEYLVDVRSQLIGFTD
jgi:hypothetical protein